MAISIKSTPVLTGKTAVKFNEEADNNKNQATPTLSEKAAERLKKVLENQSRSRSKDAIPLPMYFT